MLLKKRTKVYEVERESGCQRRGGYERGRRTDLSSQHKNGSSTGCHSLSTMSMHITAAKINFRSELSAGKLGSI